MQMARMSMQRADLYFVEEPLLNLGLTETSCILTWMDNCREDSSINILKIPAKSGNTTLLFEPGDIDFIESYNKNNYISVRETLFQVAQNMDELEGMLCKSGFFRCHRSYIVNMQKVDKIERLSKNSFCLLLNNKEGSRIPLSKKRAADMKITFGW